MATDLVNFKRVKSLRTQIELTEKKGFQSLLCLSISEFSEGGKCLQALGEINTQSQIAV